MSSREDDVCMNAFSRLAALVAPPRLIGLVLLMTAVAPLVRIPATAQTTTKVASTAASTIDTRKITTVTPPTSRAVPEYLLPVEQGLRRIRISIAASYEGKDEGPNPVSVSFACTAARLFGYLVKSTDNPLSFSLFHNDGPLILTFEIKPKSACQLRVDGDGVSQILSNGLPLRTAAVANIEPRTIANLTMESDSVVEIDVARPVDSIDGLSEGNSGGFSIDSPPTTSSTSSTVASTPATSTLATGSTISTPPSSQVIERLAPAQVSQLVRFREVVQTSSNESIQMEKSRCTGTREPNPGKSGRTIRGQFSEGGTRETLPGVVCAYSFTGVGFDLTERIVVLLNGAEPRLTALGATLSVAVPQDTHTNLRVFLRPSPAELFPGSRAPRLTTSTPPASAPSTTPQRPSSTQAKTSTPTQTVPRSATTAKPVIKPTVRPAPTRAVLTTTRKRAV